MAMLAPVPPGTSFEVLNTRPQNGPGDVAGS
jgi:hypothetical protein